MITKISLLDEASYANLVEIEPNKINYLYGGNGTGKTTLANVISHESKYPSCSLKWKNSENETIVYNKSFVENNFSQSNSIKGIFTLGKDSKEAQEFIDQTNEEINNVEESLEGDKRNIQKKEEEKKKLREEIIEKCWNQKRKHEAYFEPAFQGNIRSKEIFFKKCLLEQNNDFNLLELDELKKKYEAIYERDLDKYSAPKKINYENLKDLENQTILKTKIVGTPDSEIADLIDELENSDWIKEGVKYLEKSQPQCPFCQQRINERLQNKIKSFFDEKYENQISELESYIKKYHQYIRSRLDTLQKLSDQKLKILDYNELDDQIKIIEEKFRNNQNVLAKKEESPSLSIELESLGPIFLKVNNIIGQMAGKARKHNEQMDNIEEEREKLESEIWKYIATETAIDIESYQSKSKSISKALNGLKNSRKSKKERVEELKRKIREKESELTSISHSENEINKILKLFGFNNFELARADKKGHYKLIREDGSDVKESLSEGEYTFITFLYFYHLLNGSTEKEGITRNKVVVIDDPISSLDTDVLFVVSNLIKEIIHDCRSNKNGFKQVFVLTHNIYFHKEVTFRGNGNNKWKEESYWILRKLNNATTIEKHDENPVKTSYQLLWNELDDLKNINTATIFNTMRRILEYYFKIIGGINYEACINEFEGEEKIICKSLVSWVNDGSHFINDDLVVNVEPETVERYRDVFKSIFDNMDHSAHYNMMMQNN